MLPGDLQLARFEFPEPVLETKVEELAALPVNWTRDEDATRRIGGQWQQHGSSCLLAVPSAILPEESDAKRLRLARARRFPFDPRLI